MMLIEAAAAGIVGAAMLWLVLQPLLLPASPAARLVDVDEIDPEETRQGQALLALREIDFDRATGKLSDQDYADLHARFSAIAVAALEEAAPAPVSDALEVMIAARARSLRAPAATDRVCRVHGVRAEQDARFCGQCGAGLLTQDGHCAGCSAAVPEGAAFCPGCGVAVRAPLR